MRKVMSVLARSSLVAAFCCSVSFAQTAVTSRPGAATRISGAESRLPQSPRELLKRGKEFYLQGLYGKAVEALEQIPADADLSETDAAQLEKLLAAARHKAESMPARKGVTARAQSPETRRAPAGGTADIMGELRKEARRLADADPADRKTAASKWMATARAAYNHGDLDDAEQVTQMAIQIDAPFKATEDSPEKLMAELQMARKQEMAWSKDHSSPQARQARSKYLLTRATQVGKEGDLESAQRYLAEAEKLQVTPGVMDPKPAQVREQLMAMAEASGAGMKSAAPTQTARRASSQNAIQQVSFEDPNSPEVGSDAMKVKADKALREAQLAEKRGQYKDAMRMAGQARHLEVQGNLQYRPNELRPSQYLAELTKRVPQDPAAVAIMEKEVASNKADADESLEFARSLLASAREDMLTGDLQTAREKVEHVMDLKVRLGAKDADPAALLAEIDKMSTAKRTASRTGTGTRARTASTGGAGNAGDKAKAQQLLAEAKAAYEAGDLDKARAKTLAASQIKVAYDTFEDDPHQLMTQIDDAATSRGGDGKMIASTGSKGAAEENPFESETTSRTATTGSRNSTGSRTTARTGSGTGRRGSGLPASSQKQRALELVDLARTELEEGRLEDARRLAKEAEEINTVYGLLDDRPELVLADIERAEATSSPNPNAGRRTAQVADSKNSVKVSPELRSPDLAKRQATLLLKQARQDLKANRLKEAEEKALQAEKLDAAYAEFEDTPSMVLAEVERANSIVVAGAKSPETGSSENPFDSSTEHLITQTGGVDVSTINPDGDMSAATLYQNGMLAFRRGDKAGAYHLFLQAYQSGENLPPRMKQQLEDFLQALSPKTKPRTGQIQLAGMRQVEGGDAGQGGAGPFDAEPETPAEGTVASDSPLEKVDQQLAVQVDALRTQVMNATFRAERAREKNPEEALKILDKAQLDIENSNLPKTAVTPLLKSLARSRDLAQASVLEQKSNLDQQKHNKAVTDSIKSNTKTQVRIEQEFADMTQQFNDLMKQRRYAEAELIAKKAKELDPENVTAELMVWKALFAKRNASNNDLKDKKEKGFWGALDSVEWSAIPYDDRNPITYPDAKTWNELTNRRKGKYGPDNHIKTEEEKRIEKSLLRQVSMHFENEPLESVINKLAVDSNINFRLDPQGLEEVQVDSSTPITINVDGIQMKSALNLILQPLHLGYAIRDEVLKITSVDRQKGDLETRVYSVADLVLPLPNFANGGNAMANNGYNSMQPNSFGSPQFDVAASKPRTSGQAFAQVQDGFAPPAAIGTTNVTGRVGIPEAIRKASTPDFDSLMDLVISTVEPSSWDEVGGPASIRPFETTLSLVIRQTQAAHDEIQDLLAQLRRLQDLQVSVEVRFVTVHDSFFERIGIDFDWNLNGTAPGAPNPQNFGDFLPPFGNGTNFSVATSGTTTSGTTTSGTTTSGTTTSGTTTSGTSTGSTSGGSGTGTGPFTPGPPRDLVRRGDYPKLGTIVGLDQQLTFSNDLQIPFRQGSFDVGIPDFGSFKPDAGISMGFAILSDIETFFFIQAAQGDSRSNILFAPKVTLFNGQLANVQDTLNRPFVVGQTPVVGAFTVAFAPNVQIFTEGVTLLVTAVVSADRRYVRLSLVPHFTSITDVFTFTFSGAAGSTGQGSNSATGFQGNGGNIGGSTGGGSSTGLSGGSVSSTGSTSSGTTTSGTTTSGTTNSGTNSGNVTTVGLQQPATQTVQQPVQEIISIQTAVSVPDGGTVLLGSVKRLKEGRNMAGVPILNKIPYISRLFKNSGVGRETDSLMMMVTPRIIIQEEEEELLGVPL